MNPHADSVQQPSDAEIVALADQHAFDTNARILKFARALLARFQSGSAGEADLIAKLQAGIDDPMWPNHFEISKHTASKIIAALSRQAPAAPAEMPDGWKLVAVNEAFDGLMVALGRAERKGYMPDAVAEDWGLFEWNDRPAAPTPAAPAEALSEERLYDLADSGEANPDAGGWGPKFDFLAFARLVERAHGIGAAPTPAEPAKTEAKCLTCNGRGTVGMPNIDELPCPDCLLEAEPVQQDTKGEGA